MPEGMGVVWWGLSECMTTSTSVSSLTAQLAASALGIQPLFLLLLFPQLHTYVQVSGLRAVDLVIPNIVGFYFIYII